MIPDFRQQDQTYKSTSPSATKLWWLREPVDRRSACDSLEDLLTLSGEGPVHRRYRGELGNEFGLLDGRAGRSMVVPEWERQVRPNVEQLEQTAERRAGAHRRRDAG